MKRKTVCDEPKIENGELICPFCGGEFLHHGIVNVYTRREEDAPVSRVSVDDDGNLSTKQIGDNDSDPTERRGAVTIEFRCEQCERKFQMEVRQNRGRTIIINSDIPKKGRKYT